MSEKENGSAMRWLVLVAGIVLQTAIGGIYAWSAFVPSLVELGLTRTQTGLLLGVQILVFTVVTIPAGAMLRRWGPRVPAFFGALLFCTGYGLASLAGDSFVYLLISIGFVAGMGIGMVYVCPLSTGMQWFPRNRGMVTGAATAGFGLGAILLANVANYAIDVHGKSVHEMFQITASLFGGTALVASLFLKSPAAGVVVQAAVAETNAAPSYRSPWFLTIVLAMFSATFAGLLLSGNLKPFILSTIESESFAVTSITLFAIGNTAGRLTWGVVHDRFRSFRTILVALGFLAATLLAIVLVIQFFSHTLLLPLILCVGFGFGASFVIYASAIVERFGMELLNRLYPIAFVGYGIAALVAPATGGMIADVHGTYTPGIALCFVLVLVAFAVTFYTGKKEFHKRGDL